MADWAELFEEGKRRYMAGEFPEASNALRRAVEAAPDSVETWRALGFALASAGNPPDAKAAFRKAIELKPDDADAHYGLARVESEMGDSQKAIELFDAALGIRPQHARAKSALVAELVKQGVTQRHSGDKVGGGASLERAFKTAPGNFAAVDAFCEHLVDAHKYLEAYEAAQAAKRSAPNDPNVQELFKTLDTDPRITRAKRERGLV